MQGKIKTIGFTEGGYNGLPGIDSRTLEDRLNELRMEGHAIISVTCISHSFRKDGSNHGHGGKSQTSYVIIVAEPLSDEIVRALKHVAETTTGGIRELASLDRGKFGEAVRSVARRMGWKEEEKA